MPRTQSLIIPALIIFTFVAGAPILGCSTSKENKSASAGGLIVEGKKQMKLDSPEEAKAIFQRVLEEYPDSKERIAALMLLARAYYQSGEYEEAKFHYMKFIKLYPAHKSADHAHYYTAMSDFKMMDIASRDQSSTREALQGFEYLIKNFPRSPYRPKAEEKRKKCLHNLARNFFEIGKFYFRTGSYQSAIFRLKKLMRQYPDQTFIDEAIFLLGESYYHEQNFQEAKSFYKKLLKNYPRSLFAKEARLRLKAFQ